MFRGLFVSPASEVIYQWSARVHAFIRTVAEESAVAVTCRLGGQPTSDSDSQDGDIDYYRWLSTEAGPVFSPELR